MDDFAEECGIPPWVVTDGNTPVSSPAPKEKTPASPLVDDDKPAEGYGATSAFGRLQNMFTGTKMGHKRVENVDESAGEKEDCGEYGITDMFSYHAQTLSTWKVFAITYKTVWVSPELWAMMRQLGMTAAVVAVITVIVIWNPERLRVGKFTSISKFLNVVVGLMLSFFLASSMKRYHNTVDGFLSLLDAIRNLFMQFIALGVPMSYATKCMRWAFSSAWLLYGQLLVETHSAKPEGQQQSKRDKMWERLATKTFYLDPAGNTNLLKGEEIRILRQTRDPSGMMWFWIALLIGRLAQDGFIPPMASPTYGRIMSLAEAAHAGIRDVRQNVTVQAPLTYTHMLASLVHINNLLNAVTLGIVSGLAIGTAMMAHDMHPYTRRDASGREATQDYQTMAVTFMYCFFGPLIYQALLLIAMHLAQPFDEDAAMLPLHRLLHQVEVDMCNNRDLAGLVDFAPPRFKQPPK